MDRGGRFARDRRRRRQRALALGRFIERFLFDVATVDPATLTMVVVALGSAAVLASFLPARRAASVDPSRALQEE